MIRWLTEEGSKSCCRRSLGMASEELPGKWRTQLALSICYSAWDTHACAQHLFEACILTSGAKGPDLPLHKFSLLERNSDKHHYGQVGLSGSNKTKFLFLCIENGSCQRRLQAGVTSLEEQVWKSLYPGVDLNRTQMHVKLSQGTVFCKTVSPDMLGSFPSEKRELHFIWLIAGSGCSTSQSCT